ncbi:exported protein of unknown function [uncultured Sphingopyxis sp.]|uniref:Protein activator of alkane oxidation PraB n=1 Tax=uncultured Sphingopyxis sp. TaxID=310581 RepID=A0A1Y5PW31_9SPHN|nr:exported protein of unknown function [uncultured Sphingopyxis sp.]
MKKFSVISATALALATPGIAHASATPDGLHSFTGTLEVQKSLGIWTSCSVDAKVDVSSSVPRLQSVTLSGGLICPGITFTGLPSAPLDVSALPVAKVPAVTVNIAFPAGTCSGSLSFLWGGNTPVPRTIAFQDGLSNIPSTSGGTAPCRIRGVLSQTAATPPLSVFNP